MIIILNILDWVSGLPPSFFLALMVMAAVITIASAATLIFLVTSDSRTQNFIRIANVILRPLYRTREHRRIREHKNKRQEEHILYFEIEPEAEAYIERKTQQRVIDQ